MRLFEDIVHKALASEIRREILLSLAKNDKYLTEISKEAKKKPQTVDFHLTLLEEIGLITSYTKGGKKYYSLKDKRILDFLRKDRPLPPHMHPKPPHEIVMDAWDDIGKRLDAIEEKLNKVLKKLK